MGVTSSGDRHRTYAMQPARSIRLSLNNSVKCICKILNIEYLLPPYFCIIIKNIILHLTMCSSISRIVLMILDIVNMTILSSWICKLDY